VDHRLTAAINLARKVFEETFQQASLKPELARKWVDLNVERLHALLLDMDTPDAMKERARIKKPEGRACASPPLTFSAAATTAGTKILSARRDAGSGFGTRPT